MLRTQDSDTLPTNGTTGWASAVGAFIVACATAVLVSLKYTAKDEEVSGQEVSMHSGTSIIDL
jgi:hypothetical protein